MENFNNKETKEKKEGVKPFRIAYNEQTLRRLIVVSTVIYGWLLVWIIWFKMNDNESILFNYSGLKTFTTKERFLYDIIPFNFEKYDDLQRLSVLLNLFVFAPFGVLLPFLFRRKSILRDLLICFCVSLSFEVIQFFSMIGGFATDDLIMNTLGYFVGLIFYYFFFKKRSMRFNVNFFIIVNAVFSLLVIYSIIGTINSLDVIVSILTRRI